MTICYAFMAAERNTANGHFQMLAAHALHLAGPGAPGLAALPLRIRAAQCASWFHQTQPDPPYCNSSRTKPPPRADPSHGPESASPRLCLPLPPVPTPH
jgi:hypothetical protein